VSFARCPSCSLFLMRRTSGTLWLWSDEGSNAVLGHSVQLQLPIDVAAQIVKQRSAGIGDGGTSIDFARCCRISLGGAVNLMVFWPLVLAGPCAL
jgi:hypothetical protein